MCTSIDGVGLYAVNTPRFGALPPYQTIVQNLSDKEAMETALSEAFRAATRKANARNGSSTGTTDNVGTDKEPRVDRETSRRTRQTLWRKRAFADSRVHEGNKAK
jgi:hypothetical protein